MKIISGPASKELAEKVSALTGFGNVPVAFKVFPDGESYVRLEGNVQRKRWILQLHSSSSGWRLFQLAFMADAAKRGGAKNTLSL